MARTVAALYDTRAEAELARARLVATTRTRSPQIIAKDTAGAVDGLKIARTDAETYREGLRRGAHLFVAEVSDGANAKRIIEILKQSAADELAGAEEGAEEGAWGDAEHGIAVKLPRERRAEPAATVADAPRRTGESSHPQAPAEPMRAADSPEESPKVLEEDRIPVVEEELRVGKRQVVRGGARVRSFTREAPAEEKVSLTEEVIDIENRPGNRELSEEEVEQGGLFKERVFEIAEMREEPVVTRVAFVREEIIVRKTVREREETVRDTLRHTEVEIEDLSAEHGTAPGPLRPARR